MNSTALTVLLIIYLSGLIVIGVNDIRKAKDFEGFAVAGKKQTSFVVIFSLLATIIGASTTMGITTTVYNIGFPGIWWLLFGAIGLFLQSLLISDKFRSLNADTCSKDNARKTGRNDNSTYYRNIMDRSHCRTAGSHEWSNIIHNREEQQDCIYHSCSCGYTLYDYWRADVGC